MSTHDLALSDEDSGERSGRRIVLAEDEAIIRLDLRETLESLGHEVVAETGRGDEAVGLIEQHHPDLAILDVKMPGQTGLEVARVLNDQHLCAVLILSAFSQAELVAEAAEAGVLAYLIKPFQENEIAAAITVACSRFAQMNALVAEVDDLSQRLAARKVIDRAKGTLMDDHGLNEADAFAFVQKSAMATRSRMSEVANQILAGELTP